MGIHTTTQEFPKNFFTVAGSDLHMYLPVFSEEEGKKHMSVIFEEVQTLKPLIAAIKQQSGLKFESIEAMSDEKSPTIGGFKETKGTLLS